MSVWQEYPNILVVHFDRPTQYRSRYGTKYAQTTGVEVCDGSLSGTADYDEIHLSPINSKGKTVKACRVVVRKEHLGEVIEVLAERMDKTDLLKLVARIMERVDRR